MNQTQSKVILITGAAHRIGKAITQFLHERGCNVIVHYHTSARAAQHLAEQLNQQRTNSAIALCADLKDIESLPLLIEQAAAHWQRLDGLINNASQFYPTLLPEVKEHQWDDLLNTNLKGPFFLAQAAIPFLRKTRGSLINITDIHAQAPMRHYSVYCMSKSGLLMLTKALARDLGPAIRVNAVAPSVMLWPEDEANVLSEQVKNQLIERTALKCIGEPIDIAKAVWFLLQDAPYITGQVITVDGGRTLWT